MRITGGQVFDLEQGFVSRDVCFDGEKLEQSSAGGKTYDASGCYVIPGLTDLHFHGCVGEDFSDATPDGLQKMAEYELSRGVTQICPAGMTLGEDQLTRICQNAAAHRARSWWASTWRDPSCARPRRGPRTRHSSTTRTRPCSTACSRRPRAW